MQHAIVPYVPPSCSNRSSHRRSFVDFVRRGGRVNPIPLAGGAYNDPETAPLMGDKQQEDEFAQMMRMTNRQARVTQCAIFVLLAFTVAVIGGLGVVVWRVNDNMNAFEGAIRPHANQIVNATVEMMTDMGSSFHNMHEISEYTNELAAVTGGESGTASLAVNNTAKITERLVDFLKNPVIKLSLGSS